MVLQDDQFHKAVRQRILTDLKNTEWALFDELQTIYETEKKEHALAIQEQTITALHAEAAC